MPHSFTISIRDEISSILKKVESEITGSGGRFEGNTECGFFDGKSILGLIKGEYRCLSDKEIKITITAKPFIVPDSRIESEIKKYFS